MMRYLSILSASLLSLSAHAFNWQDLWLTPDQQGQKLMAKSQFKEAKETFARSDWAAAAAYRAGDYKKAAELYQNLKSEEGYYNQGNALAHLGEYEQAIKAYDKALATTPTNQDALHNRKLVEELLKNDKNKEQNKDKQNKDKQDKDKQDKDKQDKDKQDKDKQDKDKQDKDKQDKDKQDKDKQDKDKQDKDKQDKEKQDKEKQDKENQDKDKQDKDKQDKEKQDKEKQDKEKQDKEKQDNEQQNSEEEREKQQAKEQWLRLIPDDPGGLMREKFLRDHLRRQRGWDQ